MLEHRFRVRATRRRGKAKDLGLYQTPARAPKQTYTWLCGTRSKAPSAGEILHVWEVDVHKKSVSGCIDEE
jgi:hypothetical protein